MRTNDFSKCDSRNTVGNMVRNIAASLLHFGAGAVRGSSTTPRKASPELAISGVVGSLKPAPRRKLAR
jgi:hypothetical protein